jgi:hypothetical protein
VGRYADTQVPNDRYRERFSAAAEKLLPGEWQTVVHGNSGEWLADALERTTTDEVVVDITGLSNRALFTALDIAARAPRNVFIAYSEAREYFPKLDDWKALEGALEGSRSFSEIVDERPWLFGTSHSVELIPGHEGYDSAASGRALLAFLPFKSSRLAAILGQEDYADCVFVAGRPRLPENAWRLEAVKRVNESIVKERSVIEVGTFGYRSAFKRLSDILLGDSGLLGKYDVHVAILGSKLQDVACWMLSCMVPSLTIITSVPFRYYPEAFSDGIGAQWVVSLTRPSF